MKYTFAFVQAQCPLICAKDLGILSNSKIVDPFYPSHLEVYLGH
jgi:hypothetical protein